MDYEKFSLLLLIMMHYFIILKNVNYLA